MQGRLLDELWKVHFIDRNVSLSIDSLWANEDLALIRLICKKAKGVTPSEVRSALKRAKIRIDFPVPTIPGGRPPEPTTRAKSLGAATPASDATFGQLIQAGLIRAPLRIEREYKGVHLSALVRQDGKVEFDGQVYESPSTAAGMARKSVIGAPSGRPFPQTNGWTFWMYSDEDGGRLRQIDNLRRHYLARQK